jgi:prepilin-type N-terminal cleavage/methylation domain-containing protein
MTRQRGMTLVEIMIAMFLASLVSAAVLMITRTQLIAYEQNDQVIRMQQNERAGVGFLENLLRRACGGIQYGQVGVNVGTVQLNTSCLNVYDGATTSSGSFTNSAPTTGMDAVEVIYGTSPFTATTAMSMNSATPTVTVVSTAGFSVNDYVLVVQDFQYAGLFQISAIDQAGKVLSLGSLSAALAPGTGAGKNMPANFVVSSWTYDRYWVMKAVTESLYVDTTSGGNYTNMLMLDPDGVAGTSHSDADPLVENVVDFQVAMGCDDNADGVITENTGSKSTDEWYGNASGELPLAFTSPWDGIGIDKKPMWLRLSFIFQTGNKYSGGATPLPAFEDRTAASYPAVGAGMPRYRPVRINIAPREWNMLN